MSTLDTAARAPWAHRIAALVFLAVGVGVLTGAFAIDEGTSYQAVGPRTFPLLVGIGMCLVSILDVVRAFRDTDTAQVERVREEARVTHWPSVLLLCVTLVGYVVLLTPLGYWQSTTVFFVLVARVLGSRKLVRDAVIALVLALAIYFLFDRLLGIHLPPGILRLAI